MKVRAVSTAIVAVVLGAIGCHSSHEYNAKVRLDSIDVVAREDGGAPASTDLELSWTTCPGVQRQLMRTGRDFSACIAKYKAGDEVAVKIVHEWNDHGYYDMHVVDVGGCIAPKVDDDDSSFDNVAECEVVKQHDAVVGFHCDRVPEGELVRACPWFRKI